MSCIATVLLCVLLAVTGVATPILSAFGDEGTFANGTGTNASASAGETSDTEQRVIRVAFPQQAGLTYTDEDGSRSGYTYEYLERIAQQTGWKFEYVTLGGDINDELITLLDMLAAGEVDVMGAMSYSDSLAAIYDYAIKPYGNAHTALLALDGDTEITDTSIYSFEKLRVATNGPSPLTSVELKTFCDMNGIDLEIVQCDSSQGQSEAVLNGKADVVLGVDILPLSGFHQVASFTPKPFYFATTKGNTDIVAAINEALTAIDSAEPQFRTDLYNKYFSGGDTVAGLSAEMEDYIADNSTVRVGYVAGEAPIQDTDSESGELVGASRGALDHVGDYTGLSIEMVEIPSELEISDAVEQFALDAVAGVPYDFDYAREAGLSLSIPYLTSQQWLIVNNGIDASDLSGKQLATTVDRVSNSGDVENTIVFDTLRECIAAVNKGEADYTYADGYTAPFYINMGEYRSITAIPETATESGVCFAFPSSPDPTLLKIFNKAIQEMPAGVTNASIYGQISQTQKMTLEQFIRDHAIEIAAISLLVAMVIIILAALYARERAKTVKAINVEKERLKIRAEQDDLTGLLNIGAFRERIAARAEDGRVGAFFVVDIDDFKAVNDTQGHQRGDEVLKALADALRKTFRKDDCIGRLGGDEFVVCVIGPMDRKTVEERCVALIENVKDTAGDTRCEFFVSIGAVCAGDDERYDDLYERADRAMYEAKRKGKHGYSIG